MLTEKQIEEFQKLYKTRFGKELTREEAHERGMKIVLLLKSTYSPKPQ